MSVAKPDRDKPENGFPLVVLPHGGPFGLRERWGFDAETQFLANRGYAVLKVNFRGSGGYGRAFEAAGYQEWGGKMQDDITDGVLWAIEQGPIDASVYRNTRGVDRPDNALAFVVEEGKRYFVAARIENNRIEDWRPVVVRVEPIPKYQNEPD